MEMKDPVPSGDDANGQGENQSTGLPWPRSWRGVYTLVLGSFLLWVVLLYTFRVTFQ